MNYISPYRIFSVCIMSVAILFSGALQAGPGKMSISKAVKSFAEKHNNLRLTVADFAGTDAVRTKYDTYIADSLLYELGKQKKFRLIERKRLHSVLNELALSQTSVISAGQALRIGEILPVDVLVTGSYTRLGSSIVVNGRFINVVTGEIIHTISFSMDADTSPDMTDKKDACKEQQESVIQALNDLTTRDKIDDAVRLATSLPFEMKCGTAHFGVMSVFRRYKIYPDAYRKFLIRTLISIKSPSLDSRAMDILRYFASDGSVDNEEWKAGLHAVQRSRSSTLHSYLRYLFNNNSEPIPLVKKRVDRVIEMGRKKEIGRPVAFTEEEIFFNVMSGLSNISRKSPGNRLYTFEKFSHLVADTDMGNRKALGMLKTFYFRRANMDQQKKTIGLIINFLKKREKGQKTASRLWVMARKLERKIKYSENNKMHSTSLDRLNKGLADWFCFAASSTIYKNQKNDRRAYLKRHGIRCKP